MASEQIKNIVIVGCGYIGCSLGARLSADPVLAPRFHRILGTTTTPSRLEEIRQAGLRPVLLRLSREEELRSVLDDCSIAVVTVAPGRTGGNPVDVYLEGARSLVRAAEATDLKRIIYTSSISVYGHEDGSWVDETTPPEPRSERGKILLETEREFLAGGKRLGIVTTVLRLSGIYGPNRGPQNLIHHSSGQERSDGDAYINLVHRDDIVEALIRLLDNPYHGVLNLNDDRPVPRREYYDRLVAASGLPPIRWVKPERLVLGKRVRNSRVKQVLGLELKFPTH